MTSLIIHLQASIPVKNALINPTTIGKKLVSDNDISSDNPVKDVTDRSDDETKIENSAKSQVEIN